MGDQYYKSKQDELKIMDYQELTIYAFKADSGEKDFLLSIRNLYQDLKNKKIYDILTNTGMYAMSVINDEGEKEYWVGCNKQLEETQKIVINSGKYFFDKCQSDNQEDISKLVNNMLSKIRQISLEDMKSFYCVEEYVNGRCNIYIRTGRKLDEKEGNKQVLYIL